MTAWFSDDRDHLVREVEDSDLRYSVASLMIATAVVALSIALLKLMSLFGVLLILVAMVIGTRYLNQIEFPGRRVISHGLWGIVLPMLCIIYDPGFLHASWYVDPSRLSFELEKLMADHRGMFLLPMILWQCMGLAFWLLFSRQLHRMAGIFCGFFHIGSGIAFLIGVCLLPFSCIGLIAAGLGLLGLTPFWTAYTYHQVANQAYHLDLQSKQEIDHTAGLKLRIASGLLLAIVVPLIFSMWVTETSVEDLFQLLF